MKNCFFLKDGLEGNFGLRVGWFGLWGGFGWKIGWGIAVAKVNETEKRM
jgi:hypothetical protein